jgi:hypothetical protein
MMQNAASGSLLIDFSDHCSVLTDILVLVSVPVTSLGESLLTEGTGKGAHALVRAHVVHHVA